MPTNAEMVSRVMNSFNSVSKDTYLPKKYVLKVLRDKATFFISQKWVEGTLQRDENIYTEIKCFALEETDKVKCDIVEFRRASRLMKSVNKLPKLIYSKVGNSLKEVTSIDDETEFKETTPSQYRRDKDRGFSDYSYYYVKDGYLYLVDSKVSRLNLYVATLNQEDIIDCLDDCLCKSVWDYDFKCPDKLLEVVVAETIKEISLRLNIPKDENPNLNSNER